MTAAQLECLSSPVRVNLYEAIRNRGRASATELADDSGKTVHSLYYHLKSLQKANLIRICDYRRAGKRDEAVFEAVSKRLVFEKDSANPAYTESLIKTVRIALRKAEQEHREARRTSTSQEDFAVLRIQANLSTKDAEELKRKIEAIGKWVRNRDQSNSHNDSKLVSLTCLAVPLESRN